MRACIKETGEQKLFSANITADDPAEMIRAASTFWDNSAHLRRTAHSWWTATWRVARGSLHAAGTSQISSCTTIVSGTMVVQELPRSVLALPSCRTRRGDEPA